jgi:CCR4-NOT complex subunit CAF16
MAAASSADGNVIEVKDLTFTYDRSLPPVLHDVDLTLKKGERLLVVGDNGAGKTTLLRILAGRHKHPEGSVMVLGRESFFDTGLDLHRSYMGSDWGRRTVAFAGYG